jgi:hypothetical protein
VANIDHLKGGDKLRDMYPKVNSNLDALNTDIANANAEIDANYTTLDTKINVKEGESIGRDTVLTNTVDANKTDIESKLNAHKASTTDHPAQNITYSGSVTGQTTVKGAIDQLKSDVTNIVANSGSSNTEIVDARKGTDNVARATLGTYTREIEGKANTNATDIAAMKLVDTAINTAQANIQRTLTHSGVVDYVAQVQSSLNSGTTTPYGQVKLPSSGQYNYAYGAYSEAINVIQINPFNAMLNGYKVYVSKVNNVYPTDAGLITLPAPPTFSSRDDLVFLEGYFPANGNGVDMSWRLRTVAGVDFGTYKVDGFTDGSSSGGNSNVNYFITAQGGNSSPLAIPTSADLRTNFFNNTQRASFSAFGTISFDDVGLLVCGRGDSTSKTNLATYDGYSYAIPLFRIKRRNSGGWNKNTNLSGARDYASAIERSGSAVNINPNQTGNILFNNSEFPLSWKVGDFIQTSSGSLKGQIQSISVGSTQTTVTLLSVVSTTQNYTGATFQTTSDRPDGAYSNIIQADDIIDLRHLARSSYNLQSLLEETLDKAERGELVTKDTKTAYKEHFNLQKAPLGLAQDLQSVNIKRADGTVVALKNLLGMDGNCESVGSWNTSLGSIALDSANMKYGSNAIKLTSSNPTSAYLYKNILSSLDATKYYIAVAEIKNGTATSASFYFNNGSEVLGSSVTSTSYGVSYKKIAPSDISGKVKFEMGVRLAGSSGQFIYVDGIRIYEISSSDYNLIDVDANYTGGDKISILFPYTDSPVNFVENLLPPFNDSGWTINSQATVTSPNSLSLSATGDFKSSTIDIPATAGQTLTLSASMTGYSSSSVRPYVTIEARDSGNVALGSVNGYITTSTGTAVITYSSLPVGTVKVRIWMNNQGSASFTFSNAQLEQGSTANSFVPFGRFYIPYDYAVGTSKNYITESFNSHRQTFSDAQISETVTDRVEALMTPQKHITVTQATAGQWAANDTIKFTSYNGVISGVIDSDTGSSKVIGTNETTTLTLDDVSKFVVNDTVIIWNPSSGSISAQKTITAVDTNNKTITVDSGAFGSQFWVGAMVVETTTSSSAPVVTATGIVGTWSGLGTKTATYTITTPPSSNQSDILFKYSVNYPSGKGLANLPVNVDLVEVNGQRHVSGNTVSVKANFDGKVSGSTDLIPHIASYGNATSLIAPSGTWTEMNSSQVPTLYSLDNSNVSWSINSNLQQAEMKFSYDLIRLIEDKYGETAFVGCLTTADKVAWLKNSANVSKITCNWWGYGSKPSGYNATLQVWDNGAWTNLSNSTGNSSAVSKLVISSITSISTRVQSDGFIHFLAYADPSDGVTASTIYTDFVELEVELNVAETGYTVFQPENQMPVLSENLALNNQAFPVDVGSDVYAIGAASLQILNQGLIKVTGANSSANRIEYSFIGRKVGYYTYSIEITNPNGTDITINSQTGADGTVRLTPTSQVVKANSTQTLVFVYQSTTVGDSNIRFYESAGNEFRTGKFKIQTGTVATSWSAGRNKKKILNGLGKRAGSMTENPIRIYYKYASTFDAPSTFTQEIDQAGYDSLSKQDGVLYSRSTSTVGQYAQMLIEYDPNSNMSLKEFKAMLRSLTANAVLYGQGDNAGALANGASIKAWYNAGSNWNTAVTNTSSSPSALSPNINAGDLASYITNNQKMYVLVHSTYPASASNASSLFVDYCNLTVTLSDQVDYIKANVVKVNPQTKEIKTMFPAISYRSIGNGGGVDRVSLYYRYVPWQGDNSLVPDALLKRPDWMYITSEASGKSETFSGVNYDKYKNIINKIFGSLYSGGDYTGQRLSTSVPQANESVTPSIMRVPLSTGLEGTTSSFKDAKTALLDSGSVAYLVTDPTLTSAGKFVNFVPFLVLKNSEVYLAIKHRSSSLVAEAGQVGSQAVLFRVEGRPLAKGLS